MNAFPCGVLLTRRIGFGADDDPPGDTPAYESAQIDDILVAVPQARFVLVGDDGESDPTTYAAVRERYPDRIEAVWIRRTRSENGAPLPPDQVPLLEILGDADPRALTMMPVSGSPTCKPPSDGVEPRSSGATTMTTDTDSAHAPNGPDVSGPPRPDKRAAPIAASAATWAFAFLVFRVFAVSGYDWNTAFLVSTTLGLDDGVAIVFGSLMAEHLLVSAPLVFLAPLLIAVCLWAPDGRRAVVILPTDLCVAALIALTISFERWWLPVATIAVLVVFVLIRRIPASHRLRRAVALVMARVGWISGIAVLLAAILTGTPWVPLERIETSNGEITGYVLSVDSGYLNVLTEEHDFVIVISGDVLARE